MSPAFLPTSCLSVLTPWSHGRPTSASIGSCFDACRRCLSVAMFRLAAEPPFFETEIRPILREYCFDCHGAVEEMEGGLDLRLVHLMTSGGDSGAALVPGDPDESLLLTRVRDGDMPPGETRVSDEKIAVLEELDPPRGTDASRRAEADRTGHPDHRRRTKLLGLSTDRSPASAGSGSPREHPHADRRAARRCDA